VIIVLSLLGMLYNVILILAGKHPALSGFAANSFWCLFNIIDLSIMIRAAYWDPGTTENESDTENAIVYERL
jgi:hypothetical protein